MTNQSPDRPPHTLPDTPPDGPTVFVVDDDPQLREAISLLLDSVGLRVEVFDSGEAFLQAYNPDRPGCLVLDVRLRGMSGMEVQRKLVEKAARIPTLILTAHGEVPIAVEAMKAGVLDFIEKPYSPQFLLERIQHALDQDVHRRRQQVQHAQTTANLQTLSPREKEVLERLVVGKSVKTIARDLGISDRTADFHRRNLLEKMNVENAVQLTRLVDEHRFWLSQAGNPGPDP